MLNSTLLARFDTSQSQARDTLSRVLSHDQADRDVIATQLMRYRDQNG